MQLVLGSKMTNFLNNTIHIKTGILYFLDSYLDLVMNNIRVVGRLVVLISVYSYRRVYYRPKFETYLCQTSLKGPNVLQWFYIIRAAQQTDIIQTKEHFLNWGCKIWGKKCFIDMFDHLFDMQQVNFRVTFKLKSSFYESDLFFLTSSQLPGVKWSEC